MLVVACRLMPPVRCGGLSVVVCYLFAVVCGLLCGVCCVSIVCCGRCCLLFVICSLCVVRCVLFVEFA